MQSYIREFRKLISPEISKKIISYFDDSFEDATITNKENPTDKKIRNCQTTSLLIRKKESFGKRLITNFVIKTLKDAVSVYQQDFSQLETTKISQLDLLKYETNNYDAGFKWHIDHGAGGVAERALSLFLCLNNNFSGGEFLFNLPNDQLQVQQNVGDLIIFPSSFMFPHQVNKVTSGTRYALIGWVV